MFDRLFTDMECPRCEQRIEKDRRKCPFCGLELMKSNADISEDVFFSSDRNSQSKYESGFKPKKRAVLSDDSMFSSSSRTAHNGGYTQQNTGVWDNTTYTGKVVSSAGNNEYFSSERRSVFKEEPKRKKHFVSEEEYYSSAKRDSALSQAAMLSKQIKVLAHAPNENPYDGDSALNEKPIETEHSHEYKAHNLIEFTRHRFGRKEANMILFLLIGAVICDIAALLLDLLLDKTLLSFPCIIVYTIELVVLTIMSLRTYRRRLTLTITVVTILFSVGMLIYLPFIDVTARAAEVCLLYLPIGGLNITCYHLTKQMASFQTKWETYNTPHEQLVDVHKTTDDIRIFGEEIQGNEDENGDVDDVNDDNNDSEE